MVFPVEAEERLKRRALNTCQDHFRTVLEIARKVTQMFGSFANDDIKSAKDVFTEIQKLEDEVDSVRRKAIQELAEIGGILTNREDFLRFVNQSNEIADFCTSIAFRLIAVMEKGENRHSDITNGLVKLSEGMFETVTKLREITMTLNYSPIKALEKAREVETAERIVDDLFRELEIKILNSNLEIPTLLLLRDITQLLEDISDKAQDASDAACILAFTM